MLSIGVVNFSDLSPKGKKAALKAANVETYGGGIEDPVVDNTDRRDTPDNRRRQEKNRRVSIVITRR